ncbi:plasminogen activator inhibitor 1 RNA-binding protein-like isoform X2 [Lingula anatina]|uniref:Plasminogen activator inhibitor 1 RNA-binding protein-like isoform X2 n=1 Tax=Lingula anatina TaxID=7574 RepID=A0A2R2MIP7_LINAN|nr:plasminogen activator inhibitor 1 RNA-binding protein-like isoform X2 [Lingula anatina]|eukprot:XP_023930073.1 plasminogen activator inhibitor 1 RNA-binding protein-like isoform X2 [Lingula anatina]
MATTYGIEVKNRFELVLDDEDDPFEILKEQEEQAKKKDGDKTKKNAKNEKAKSAKTKQNKKAQIIEPEPAKPKQTEHVGGRREENPPPRRQREQSARNTDTDRPQSDRRPPRQNRGPRQDRQNDDFAPREQGFSSGGEFRDRPESGRGGRGTRRGGGFGRGRGRGGFGKREFDRHSGSDKTGVKPVDKRDGGGAFNWGTVKDDVE